MWGMNSLAVCKKTPAITGKVMTGEGYGLLPGLLIAQL
jgi:hypothetical protein